MKKIILLILSIIILSCNYKDEFETINGDIYIKLIDFGSMYGASQERIDELKLKLNNSDNLKENKSDDIFINYFNSLIKHNLLEKPYFKLKLYDGEIINVFAEESEYLKLKELLDDLDRDKEKIIVKFKSQKKEKGIYYAEKILSIKKLPGKTDWEK